MRTTIPLPTLNITSDFKLGSLSAGQGKIQFLVWAPLAQKLELHLVSPKDKIIPMESLADGYFGLETAEASIGDSYFYRLSGQDRPDPASRFQPQGVHGATQIINSSYNWTDSSWKGIPLEDYVFYELHVGTFSKGGTFADIISRLPYLKSLGITAIELLPVAQFPGNRNWGYDGVYPFAVQDSYGGPENLKKLVDACHQVGLAVIMDVVYNHLGPEGNYLSQFGPYFTDSYKTPWGSALNFDGESSDHVRRFFIENALMWIREYHLDGLRLDAVHAIYDFSASPFLKELGDAVRREAKNQNRNIYLFPESDLNDSKLVRRHSEGGYGLDAQWTDDFHHSLHVLLTGETRGYYRDFGGLAQLHKSLSEGYVYSNDYSPYRGRRHGNVSKDLAPQKFIVFSQNHDQVGNRMLGERLASIVSLEKSKLAAGAYILSPYLPLIFMGEEYGEKAPFQYFIGHTDPELVEAVRKGRQKEFKSFGWQGEIPDPQGEDTFMKCKLDFNLMDTAPHSTLYKLYKTLLALRKNEAALKNMNRIAIDIKSNDELKILTMTRGEQGKIFLGYNFSDSTQDVGPWLQKGTWAPLLDSGDRKWNGPGSHLPGIISGGKSELNVNPYSFVVLKQEGEK